VVSFNRITSTLKLPSPPQKTRRTTTTHCLEDRVQSVGFVTVPATGNPPEMRKITGFSAGNDGPLTIGLEDHGLYISQPS
jgi:hypothetical protein